MNARVPIALVALLGLAACASGLNPMNWFGGDREERIQAVATEEVVDPRPLVTEITSLDIDLVPGGVIVRAVGLPSGQGYWQPALLRGPLDSGTLTLEFRVAPPQEPGEDVSARAREILAAEFFSDQDLTGVRTIVVVAQENRRSLSRR